MADWKSPQNRYIPHFSLSLMYVSQSIAYCLFDGFTLDGEHSGIEHRQNNKNMGKCN